MGREAGGGALPTVTNGRGSNCGDGRAHGGSPSFGGVRAATAANVAGGRAMARVRAVKGAPDGVMPRSSSRRSQNPWARSQKSRPALDQHMCGKQCHMLVRWR